MMNSKFESAKEKLVLEAQNTCVRYLLARYGNGKLVGEPKVELTATEGPTSSSWAFDGHITCQAAAETSKGYENLNVSLAVANETLEVESETSLQETIESDLNAAAEYLPTSEVVKASLDSFKVTDDGSKYLKVAHPAFGGSELGLVGKNEYEASKDKASLLTNMVTDAIARTASFRYEVEFTGTFVAPTIVKKAAGMDTCDQCGYNYNEMELKPYGQGMICDKCINTDLPKKAEFIPPTEKVSDDLPLGRMSSGVAQFTQAEEQKVAHAKTRLNDKVAQELHNHLYKLGFSAKVQEIDNNEITATEEGLAGDLSAIALVDDHGTNKLVAFPIKVKASTIEMPKRPLVQELVNKAIDLNERLSQELAKDASLKFAAIDEKVQYEMSTVEAILQDTILKTASDSENTMFLGDTETLTVQKHLLPNHEDLKKGDHISDGNDEWEIYDTDGQQNSKGEGDGSLWKLRKCAPPKSDEKEPKAKMSI